MVPQFHQRQRIHIKLLLPTMPLYIPTETVPWDSPNGDVWDGFKSVCGDVGEVVIERKQLYRAVRSVLI